MFFQGKGFEGISEYQMQVAIISAVVVISDWNSTVNHRTRNAEGFIRRAGPVDDGLPRSDRARWIKLVERNRVTRYGH